MTLQVPLNVRTGLIYIDLVSSQSVHRDLTKVELERPELVIEEL